MAGILIAIGIIYGDIGTSPLYVFNAIVGSIINDDRLVIHKLDNCSITILEGDTNGALRIAQGGHEADTLIR